LDYDFSSDFLEHFDHVNILEILLVNVSLVDFLSDFFNGRDSLREGFKVEHTGENVSVLLPLRSFGENDSLAD